MTKRKKSVGGKLHAVGDVSLKNMIMDEYVEKQVDTLVPVLDPEMLCYMNPTKLRACTGECRGASTHWHWETCGYGKKQQMDGGVSVK